jgi:triphosphoribosyl-dephospho-CoA synthetase
MFKPPFDAASPAAHSKSIVDGECNVKAEALILSRAASEAVLEEIMTAPKPGLVDPLTAGAHSDMDAEVFIRSAEALAPFWKFQAETGVSGVPESRAMDFLRKHGIDAERAMFAATDGINTHKGIIYLLSLLLYGAGRLVFLGREITAEGAAEIGANAVKDAVESELAPLLEELPKGRKLSNGEKLFIKHGIKGARGEAAGGFKSAVRAGLPALRSALEAGASRNNASIASLLAIMEVCEDSNIIHRAGHGFWSGPYKEMVSEARAKFDPLKDDYSAVTELEASFLPRRASPGGAADLLTCSIFLEKITSSTCQQSKNDIS